MTIAISQIGAYSMSNEIQIQQKVSVVINNYNYGRFLEQAINSVLVQTYQNVELIVVDDGSTDQSSKVLMKYAKQATIIQKKNGGQASAFNVGIARATGEFIILLDSDDYLFPDTVELCLNYFCDGYSRIYFRLRQVDEYDNTIIATPKTTDSFFHLDGCALSAAAERAEFPSVPTSGNMFDAKILKSVLPVPEKEYRICADSFIFVNTAQQGPVRSVDLELGAYRIHGSNNFSSVASGIFMDLRRLGVHLDNYYKSTALIENACLEQGMTRCAYTENLRSGFYIHQLLCAGYVHKLDSQYIHQLTAPGLSGSIFSYLRSGNDVVAKRVLQAVCMMCLVWCPRVVSLRILRLMDDRNRAAV